MILKLGEVTIELTDSVMKKLKNYVQDKGSNESGGILLGGYIPDEKKYIITDISVPCKKDFQSPILFIRNRKNAQKIIDRFWKQSNGKINYLGEWHTHSCEMPYPSFVDKALLRTIISDRSNVWNEIFMLILGQNNTFYLGMSNTNNHGTIINEVQVKGEL